jgi:hypothetical protein
MHEDELNKIIELNKSSLQRFIGIDDELWIWLLKRCDLVNESGDGKVSMTSEEKWISFFTTWEIDAEVILSSPLKTGKRRYIRLGRKGANWYNNVSKQAKNGKMDPPRCPSIQVIGRSLNAELRIMFEEEEYDEGDNWGDTCGSRLYGPTSHGFRSKIIFFLFFILKLVLVIMSLIILASLWSGD